MTHTSTIYQVAVSGSIPFVYDISATINSFSDTNQHLWPEGICHAKNVRNLTTHAYNCYEHLNEEKAGKHTYSQF